MEWKNEIRILAWILVIFTAAYFLPLGNESFEVSLFASLDLLKWYAQEHVVLCLLPAFFIAGVISIFVSQGAVLKYFGANAKKWVSYTIASVSGTILAVCSCTILPLFSSIHKRGAGLGPAVAFLYSGPAINILAIILTARILGFEMGVARVIGAVVFSVVIGLFMALIFRKEEKSKAQEQMKIVLPPEQRPLWKTSFLFFAFVFILIFANWAKPESNEVGIWFQIWNYKWYITSFFAILLGYALIQILNVKWWLVLLVALGVSITAILTANPMLSVIVAITGVSIITLMDFGENREWTLSSWDFAKQIMPMLAFGVVIAGFLLGSTHDNTSIPGIVPNEWITNLVGGNSLLSNFYASILGAFMYFATLTEVPILQGLISAGMGKGPALALLLAGPSLSLPNMLVIRNVLGTVKTLVYVALVVVMATISGVLFGLI
ncbi:MAG: hypothetical protein C0594_06400 [Marinilabiliales bacterium]|nr:MAG: hypothetical protein C0594_06400 [Marinilabiliales bacterium]